MHWTVWERGTSAFSERRIDGSERSLPFVQTVLGVKCGALGKSEL